MKHETNTAINVISEKLPGSYGSNYLYLSIAEPEESNYQVKHSFHELQDGSQNHHNSSSVLPRTQSLLCTPGNA